MAHRDGVKANVHPALTFCPLTPRLMDDLRAVLRGSWGSTCWCLYPRMSNAAMAQLPGAGSLGERRRQEMTRLARRRTAPGIVAYAGAEPIGWAAVAPRSELARVNASRATPPVDEAQVWVIPCVTVRKTDRGRGIAVALIEAAVAYAADKGATIVEAYPRAGDQRTGDDNAYFGTEPMFRQAGFRIVRQPLDCVPANWTPRVAMRTVPLSS